MPRRTMERSSDRPPTRHFLTSAATVLAAFTLQPARVLGSAPPFDAAQEVNKAEVGIATSRRQVIIAGTTLCYPAHAGALSIRENEAGETRGNVCFTYHQLDRGPGADPRPVKFLWTLRPGANLVLVHLVGLGPKRIRTPAVPLDPADRDCALDPKDASWLDFTDLVFADPIGTGFSRYARPRQPALSLQSRWITTDVPCPVLVRWSESDTPTRGPPCGICRGSMTPAWQNGNPTISRLWSLLHV